MDARQIYAEVGEKNRQLVRKYRELGRKASEIRWKPIEERTVELASLAAEEGTTAHDVELAGRTYVGLKSLELECPDRLGQPTCVSAHDEIPLLGVSRQ